MDIVNQLVPRLVAQAVTTIAVAGLRQLPRAVKHEDNLEDALRADGTLNQALSNAAHAVARASASGLLDKSALEDFLGSPEARGVVRQLYALDAFSSVRLTRDQLRNEFQALLGAYLHLPADRLEEPAKALFEALSATTVRALERGLERNSLAARDAKDDVRTRLLLDELAAANKLLASLAQTPDIAEILSFEATYRQMVANRSRYIIPPHLDAARKIRLDDLYVPPALISQSSAEAGRSTDAPMSLDEFLHRTYRTVVLGDPGGGKSTLAQKVTLDLCRRYDKRLLGGRPSTPILVTLREYGALKKDNPCSIIEFIETVASTRYQVSPPAGAFDYMLASGRALVIFDGLDELLDTSYRLEITGDVESFCDMYPSTPILVTSRKIGYDQAPLDPERFEIVHLSEFGPQQVHRYVTNWFTVTDENGQKPTIRKRVDAFIEESTAVRDLRANPLMLGLMCNIYRGPSARGDGATTDQQGYRVLEPTAFRGYR